MIIKAQCPQCGATMDVDSSRTELFCSYCGAKIVNMSERVEVSHSGTVSHIFDKYPNTQLVVRFSANRNDYPLLVRVDGGVLLSVVNGQEREFQLAPGRHDIRVKIGNRNYARAIFINSPADTVIMEVSWFGKAAIRITDNLPKSAPYANYYEPPKPAADTPSQQSASPEENVYAPGYTAPNTPPNIQYAPGQAPSGRRSVALLVWGIIIAVIFSILCFACIGADIPGLAISYGILAFGGVAMIISFILSGRR